LNWLIFISLVMMTKALTRVSRAMGKTTKTSNVDSIISNNIAISTSSSNNSGRSSTKRTMITTSSNPATTSDSISSSSMEITTELEVNTILPKVNLEKLAQKTLSRTAERKQAENFELVIGLDEAGLYITSWSSIKDFRKYLSS
jgi:hypothetical protein